MKQCLESKKKLHYYNCEEHASIYKFCTELYYLVSNKLSKKDSLVLLCIGSDRATGDCLGPIVGYKLEKLNNKRIAIYGTLAHPVHAKNLEETLITIRRCHKHPFIIAIDASLGNEKHVGYVTLGEGSLNPGIGVDKDLPPVGDIFITGIVNLSGYLNHMLLQTTRLDIVMQLADYICIGLRYILTHMEEDQTSLSTSNRKYN